MRSSEGNPGQAGSRRSGESARPLADLPELRAPRVTAAFRLSTQQTPRARTSNPSYRSMSSSDTPSGEIIVQVFGRTDVGRTREHNEDAFVVADLTTNNATLQPDVREHTAGPRGTLFMVADGMGGAAAGEIASDMAVKIILGEMQTRWLAEPEWNKEGFVRAIKNATRSANEQIHDYATSHPEFRGMGTTAT